MSKKTNIRYAPEKHHRRSIHLKDYDYSQSGAYFITICIQNRKCLFGEIINSEMRLNDGRRMVQTVWDRLPKYYTGIDIDEFVIMPNHFHGIILIHDVGAGPCACPDKGQTGLGQPRGVAPTMSLPDVVHRFKPYYHTGKALLKTAGRRFQANYGNAIITNTSSAMRMNCWKFGNTSPTTLKNGLRMKTIRLILKKGNHNWGEHEVRPYVNLISSSLLPISLQ